MSRAARPDAPSQLDLMGVLGHELRSPLTAIRGAATLLQLAIDELPREKVAELLQVIDSQAARMAGRVDDVLVASRIDSGDAQLVVDEVELSDVIADVLEAVRATERDRRIRASGLVDGFAVAGDAHRIAHALRALLENAVRHSAAGTPVEVRVQRAGGMARIEVRDRGAGIAPGDRSRIFGRGVKLVEGGPGAGLGLYVVAGLARAMGGTAGVDARQGGGSVFWFTVPAARK